MLTRSILYMMISAACFAVINSIIRHVDHLPTFELVFFRSIGTVACCWIVFAARGIDPLGHQRWLLFLRAIVGFTSMTLFYRALQLMPMASAVSLRYLSPFFAAAMAIFFLGERMRRLQWLFFCTAFVGVLLLKGFDQRITPVGLLIVLSSAVISGMVYVVIRRIGDRDHPVVVVHYFLFLSAVVSGVICCFVWETPVGYQWPMLLSIGFFGFLAQLYMTKALQAAETNLVVPFKYAEVVFTLLAGWMVFGEGQSIVAIIAMSLIVISLLGNVWVKRRL